MHYFALVLFAVLPQNKNQKHFNRSLSPSTNVPSAWIDSTGTIGAEENDFQITASEDSLKNLYMAIGLEKYNLPYEVFRYGIVGYETLKQQGKVSNSKYLLSIIDFTKPSTQKRFYTIDLKHLQVKYHTYVSHGKNTGDDMAKLFSNRVHSNQSSIGFYITGETYTGSKGYSLKLDGIERGYNDNMRQRAVVMHQADYVSEKWIKQYGRLGRSQGCPALSREIASEVIDTIKDRTVIFAYYNDPIYLKTSSCLNSNFFNSNVAAHAKQAVLTSGSNN